MKPVILFLMLFSLTSHAQTVTIPVEIVVLKVMQQQIDSCETRNPNPFIKTNCDSTVDKQLTFMQNQDKIIYRLNESADQLALDTLALSQEVKRQKRVKTKLGVSLIVTVLALVGAIIAK